ncbi:MULTISPECIES: MmcQ/YjbR family DNA-binding protein [Streptomyces]|uniref:MmcQ/YjbR family DNA-binding protein n=1 Tax=Streptomyces thermoviolaceus subsp. thermoviolaceus TaxID=66860 RepID=A0ABX0YMB1_STRTL|nr:MmcQ/YjbR family DNA-binding protein [Streptomyces thermoviolaceus]MCM3264155.1 MmcQ/YjbR family DNA-binding protein [Streptomyces thermoviolaceus]NJP13676.1 MmcQ/YjbR family DNA-binding protein [Streptomyces thermoviolaceus subsp. thermoviolaceus]WTD49309.1 MmcQ/YjbR family DNA-binding protein [Streptomyces thermoviolaceus]GGV60387.1 DNA-binding protein [Streptomyces thermoviolaceus subsp. apingens]GHA98482.1 DNA-binding protein [Streptomyces thermoviolaceus subsp. thermoviolaceus]
MTPKTLRDLCLSFDAAVEEFPFGPELSVFKVLGKMFALTALDARPLTVNLKCDPEEAVRLRATHPGLIVPGWHMNKRHWNTVTVDGSLPDRLVRELVEDSYDLVVAGLPRAQRLRLDRP